MRINLPFNDQFPQYQIVANYPGGEQSVTVDDSHSAIEIILPAGVAEEDVEILGCPLQANGLPAVGCGPCLIKERVVKPQPVVAEPPKSEPPKAAKAKKQEPKSEPTPESTAPVDWPYTAPEDYPADAPKTEAPAAEHNET